MLKNSSTIAELQARVAELEPFEAKVTELNSTVATHLATIAERDATVLELTGTVAAHVATIATRDETISGLNGTVETHVATIATRDATIVELTGQITTVDVAADAKAREIAARQGAELPPKAPGAGNKTTEGADTAGLTGMDKARAALASKMPTK
jgi:uncharacterized coiled-coil protein SlyX